ncbi:protein kinase domain-containing protein [Citrus sinensis]|nr:protein kinase domain-containing protein [Citrus sinensis]
MGMKVYWSFFAVTAIPVFCFLGVRASIVVAGNETDEVTLLEFKSVIIDDHLGVLASWNSSINYCKWHGVTCAPRHQRVTVLDLQSLQLGGSISPHMGNLSFLQKLHLQNNKIVGNIPTEIGKLVNLQRLELWNNQLSGTIPSAIGDLQNLRILNLQKNKFSANIPISIGNLKMLIQLDLSGNFLQGTIPSSFGQCEKLVAVDLSNNNFSGTLSPQLIGLSSLSLLNVSGNLLSGVISNNLGGCTSLEQLDMHGNLFEGPISSSLSSLSGLRVLDLSQNNLSGDVPEFLAGFELLQNLNLSYNNFEGMLPTKGIFKNTSATSVLGNNKLCSGIPEFQLPTCVPKKTKRNRWTLSLKLVIAIDIGLLLLTWILYSLLYCLVWKNKRENPTLRGNSIPREDPNSTNFLKLTYQEIYKATNGFSSTNLIATGNFSSVYIGILIDGRTTAVKVFNLAYSGGSESFVAECEIMRKIRHRNILKIVAAFSGADYQGKDFNALVYGFIPNGRLEEWLHPINEGDERHRAPRNLNSLKRLNIAIDIASALNYLHNDCIPSIAHCDLKPSNVLLDDEMTAHLGDFGIARYLPVETSFIDVMGTIGYVAPEYGMGFVSSYGDVYSFGILLLEMFTGLRPNDDMFNDDLNLHNFVTSALPERAEEILDVVFFQEIEEEETMYKKASSTCTQSSIILECLISICRTGVACSAELPNERVKINDVESRLRLIKKKLLKTPVYEGKQTINNPSFKDLYNATNGFSSANLIGAGNFGSVYNGTLFDGTTIAVKVFNLIRPGGSKSFKSECKAAINIKHRNIVRVFTAFSGVDYQGARFKAVVYKFMPNGSLEEWLRGKDDTNWRPLNFNFLIKKKLDIAIDVACALRYLHCDCQPPIAHCNLKPSNVLLDDEMIGHVGDFGMARFLPAIDKQNRFICIKGSTGYIPPGKMNLRNFVKMALPQQAEEVVDDFNLQEIEEDRTMCMEASSSSGRSAHASIILECFNSIREIGVACSAERPRERMKMNDVESRLRFIRRKLLETPACLEGKQTTSMPLVSDGILSGPLSPWA